ncbi:hypothetical protein F2Q70_00037091 [Brassica cretica]|uniref:Uncharacterized protein n=1 Tax=Brassica cretica TaxID=69181 RepID=A0A8S9JQM3_BRACR|nr:hypothetical protein F2Q70_00037091 [Brassica cretica]
MSQSQRRHNTLEREDISEITNNEIINEPLPRLKLTTSTEELINPTSRPRQMKRTSRPRQMKPTSRPRQVKSTSRPMKPTSLEMMTTK